MPDGPSEPTDVPAPRWSSGTSATSAEALVEEGDVLAVALFGAAPLIRTSDPKAWRLVQRAWTEGLEDAVRSPAPERLRDAGRDADDALRRYFSPADPAGRGTAVFGLFERGTATFQGTLGAVAYLVRNGAVFEVWQASRAAGDLPPHEHLGGRPPDSAEVALAGLDSAWRLRVGDRVALSTRDIRAWVSSSELVELASSGSLEAAAQTLAEVTKVRGNGTEVGVALIEWASETHDDLYAPGDAWDDVLESLSDLVPQLTDPGRVDEDLPAYEDEDATHGFAPVREVEHRRGDAVLSMTPPVQPSSLGGPSASVSPAAESESDPGVLVATDESGAPSVAPVSPDPAMQGASGRLVLFGALAGLAALGLLLVLVVAFAT